MLLLLFGAAGQRVLVGQASESNTAYALTLALAPARLYAVIYPAAASDPTAAEIKAGHQSGGSAATWAGNELAPTTSTTYDWTTPATGLSSSTSYKIAFVWSYGSENSNVAVSTSWSTTRTEISSGPSPTL